MNKNNIIGGTLKLKTSGNKTSVALRELKKVISKGDQRNKKNEELISSDILTGDSEYVKEIQKHEIPLFRGTDPSRS